MEHILAFLTFAILTQQVNTQNSTDDTSLRPLHVATLTVMGVFGVGVLGICCLVFSLKHPSFVRHDARRIPAPVQNDDSPEEPEGPELNNEHGMENGSEPQDISHSSSPVILEIVELGQNVTVLDSAQ